MSYIDLGFNENLSIAEIGTGDQLDPIQTDYVTQQVSGSKVQGGVIQSNDGKTVWDLDKNLFKVTDGIVDRIQLGVLPDGTIGLKIQDANGNLLQQVSEGKNIIQSSAGTFVIDIGNEQVTVYEGGLARMIWGRFPGLF